MSWILDSLFICLVSYCLRWALRRASVAVSAALFTSCRPTLIALLCGAILLRPLVELHIARHADKVAFHMPRQRISLLTKCENTQPESSLPVRCALHGSDTASRAIAMLVPFPVVRVSGSATSRPYAEICAVMLTSLGQSLFFSDNKQK